jgi:tannase/feruloyl esterase
MRLAALAALCVMLTASSSSPRRLYAAGTACDGLAALALKNGKVTSAAEVAAGGFVQPTVAGRGAPPAASKAYAALSDFCRVQATLKPTSDSDIKIEVWLPKVGWNGKFQAVGNGGWAGTISYPALAAAVAGGYASASTDTGHSTPGSDFAVGHPEKLVDYAYRAVHEMTVQAKAIVNAYYGAGPKLSMWNGCSTGGRQGVAEASKYPADFDAIIAGASPDPSARLHALRVAVNRIVNRTPESAIPPAKLPMLHAAVVETCDSLDGVKDGVLESPSRCRFDPKTIECKSGDGPSCLTPAQVETAKILYSDVKHPVTGKLLYAPLLQPGSELLWNTLAGPEPYGNAVEGFKVAYNNPKWDWRSFKPETDIDLLEKNGAVLNTASPNLKAFFDRGGKLLMYHGWSDQQVPAMSSVGYYNRVLDTVGKDAAGKSIQLYMVPGMTHCQGGAGTDAFNKVAAMEEWVALGTAPKQIVASHVTNGTVDRTRPLCPYPQVAKYKGTGSTDAAENFVCALDDK